MLPISAKTFAGLARPADAMRGMHAQFGDGPDVAKKLVKQTELQLRAKIDEALNATTGVQYLIRPRNEQGEFTKGAPMQFEAAGAKLRQALEGAHQLGDPKMVKALEDAITETVKGAKAQNGGTGAGDHSNTLFNISDSIRAINGADSSKLRGAVTGESRPRLAAHLAEDEDAATLAARNPNVVVNADGSISAMRAEGTVADAGAAMRARKAAAAEAELGRPTESQQRRAAARAMREDLGINQQMQSAQQQ